MAKVGTPRALKLAMASLTRGMVDRDSRHRMRRLAEPLEPLGDDGGGKVGREVDDRLAANVRQRPGRVGEVGSELGIERVRALEQEGEGPLRNVGPEAALEQRCGVEADRLGGGEHSLGGGLAHAVAGVQDAVDGGDADMGRARDIGDGGAAAHPAPSTA
jgi:hypothetical protein